MADAQRETLDRVSTNLKQWVCPTVPGWLRCLPCGRLRVSADYSDFQVTCGDDVYKTHKNIVCSRSEFFRNAERFRTQDVSIGSIGCYRRTANLSAERDSGYHRSFWRRISASAATHRIHLRRRIRSSATSQRSKSITRCGPRCGCAEGLQLPLQVPPYLQTTLPKS